MCAIGLPQALVRRHTPGSSTLVPVVETAMNVETCGHVADPIVMAHAFAELRDGVVARQHENRFQMWAQFRSNPLRESHSLKTRSVRLSRLR